MKKIFQNIRNKNGQYAESGNPTSSETASYSFIHRLTKNFIDFTSSNFKQVSPQGDSEFTLEKPITLSSMTSLDNMFSAQTSKLRKSLTLVIFFRNESERHMGPISSWFARQAGRQADRQTGRQADTHTRRQTSLPGRQTDRQTN